MPAGDDVEYGGQFENQQRAMKRLLVVVPITFGLIFLMLFFAFGSARYASLIFANVPFALLGGLVALFISGLYLWAPLWLALLLCLVLQFKTAWFWSITLTSYVIQVKKCRMPF